MINVWGYIEVLWQQVTILKSRWFLWSIFCNVDQKSYEIRNFDTLCINPVIIETAFNLTNKEALTVLCSVVHVKHTGSGWSTNDVYRETRDIVKCFSLLLEYFTTEDSTVKTTALFEHCFMIMNPLNFPMYFSLLFKTNYRHMSYSSVFYSLIKHAFSTNQSACYIWTLL